MNINTSCILYHDMILDMLSVINNPYTNTNIAHGIDYLALITFPLSVCSHEWCRDVNATEALYQQDHSDSRNLILNNQDGLCWRGADQIFLMRVHNHHWSMSASHVKSDNTVTLMTVDWVALTIA